MRNLQSKSHEIEAIERDHHGNEKWDLPEIRIERRPWRSLSTKLKIRRVAIGYIGKTLAIMSCLYFFICSLDLMSSAFRLLGAKTAGKVFAESKLLNNPMTALMVGVLVAALLHSSAIVSSVLIAMVASGIIKVRAAIPIIMGADIGTAITNIIVSLGQSGDREQFRRAFAAATVHDMFNWMSVVVFLPLELLTGFLFHTSNFIVNKLKIDTVKYQQKQMLNKVTKPFTSLLIKLDDNALDLIAKNDPRGLNMTILRRYCPNDGMGSGYVNNVSTLAPTLYKNATRCKSLFSQTNWNDTLVGSILLLISLSLLCCCLISMVKILQSILKTRVSLTIRKIINYKFPGKFAFLTGYFAIFFGAFVTFMIQSSTIFTSTLTPLVGVGLVAIENVYPMTLGSNIGTTTTGLLASLAVGTDRLKDSLQIALVHTIYNIAGVCLFYVIPFMRWPLFVAKHLGDVTSRYRWFSVAYLLFFYLVVPTIIFSLSSIGGLRLLLAVVVPLLLLLLAVICINILQKRRPKVLPTTLRSWDFLPPCMRSLEYVDSKISRLLTSFKQFAPLQRFRKVKRAGARSGQDVDPKDADVKITNGDLYNINNHQGMASTAKLIRRDESYPQMVLKRLSGQSQYLDDSGILMTSNDGTPIPPPAAAILDPGDDGNKEGSNNGNVDRDSDDSGNGGNYSNKQVTLTKVGPDSYVDVSY